MGKVRGGRAWADCLPEQTWLRMQGIALRCETPSDTIDFGGRI